MKNYHKISIILIILLTAICLTGLAGATEWTVTRNNDVAPGTPISDLKSVTLRQAIESAASGDTILFDVDTVSLTRGELSVINKNLKFDPKGKTVTIRRNTDSVIMEMRLINVTHSDVTFSGIIFEGGFLNTGSGDGGALLIMNSSASFKGCSFLSDKADDAGALCAIKSDVVIDNCVFQYCSAVDDTLENATGGAILSLDSNMTIKNTQLVKNEAGYGGAVMVDGGSCSFENCYFDRNTAKGAAGALLAKKNSSVSFDSCTFSGNTATSVGALYIGGEGSVKNSYFENNLAVNNSSAPLGGAVFINGNAKIASSVFTNNTARLATDGGYGNGNGGAVYVEKAGSAVINTSTFNGNTARYGGAVYVLGNAKVNECSFYDNYAKETGGGIACYQNSSVKVANTAMIKNTADGRGGAYEGGGAICVKYADLEISGNVLANNVDKNNVDIYCENGTILSNGGNIIRKARGFAFPQADGDVSDLNMSLSDYLMSSGDGFIMTSNERAGAGQNYVSIEKIVIKNNQVVDEPEETMTKEPEKEEPKETVQEQNDKTTEPEQTAENKDENKKLPGLGFAGFAGLILAGAAIARRGKL